MKTIETIEELKESLILAKGNALSDFYISWTFQVSCNSFNVDFDKVGILNGVDEYKREIEIATIPTSFLRELVKDDIIRFDDVSWNDNETYLYSFYNKKLKEMLDN